MDNHKTYDFSHVSQCIQSNYLEIFHSLSSIIGQYFYKIIRKPSLYSQSVFIYIEKINANKQFLLELDYKAHWYKFQTCSKYRNERYFLLDIPLEQVEKNYIISQLFKPEYIANKLLRYEDWQTNGYFLLNKLVNAYYNPQKALCQQMLAKNYQQIIV